MKTNTKRKVSNTCFTVLGNKGAVWLHLFLPAAWRCIAGFRRFSSSLLGHGALERGGCRPAMPTVGCMVPGVRQLQGHAISVQETGLWDLPIFVNCFPLAHWYPNLWGASCGSFSCGPLGSQKTRTWIHPWQMKQSRSRSPAWSHWS